MEWKNRFIKPFTVEAEPCPNCGVEINILSNGKSNCSECGQKEILPCADCPRINNNLNTCDWNEKNHCSEFPRSF